MTYKGFYKIKNGSTLQVYCVVNEWNWRYGSVGWPPMRTGVGPFNTAENAFNDAIERLRLEVKEDDTLIDRNRS